MAGNDGFAMVGTDPTAKNGAAVTITTRIVPLRITSSSSSPAAVFDPENNDICSPSRTPALNMVQNSPMFVNLKISTLPPALQPLGTGQYASLFQRASFWSYINPKASPKAPNPNYQVDFRQVLLNSEDRPAETIEIIPSGTIPTSAYQIVGAVESQSGWCTQIGVIEVNQLDALLQETIIPKLKGAGLTPTTLPIFLLANVVMYDSTLPGQQCCILGYHNAYLSTTTGATAGKLQTYIVVNYDSTAGMLNPGAFPITPPIPSSIPGNPPTPGAPGGPDIVALSTVMAGWIDNPTTLNTTPNWMGTINGVTGCQTALEVGFPPGLAGVVTAITLPSKVVYHVQDLAFKSWFYGDGGSSSTPNSGFGTAPYSLFGTFGAAAATCH
jgi:hypothetical protein